MNYYKEIKEKIRDNEIYERVKDYSKERHRVLTYFEIGRLLYEAGKHYGESIIQKYALALEKDFGKKYDKFTLYRMRQFYLLFNEPKRASLENSSSKNFYNKDNFDQKWASLSSEQKVASPSSDQKVAPPNEQHPKTLYLKDYFEQKVAPLPQQSQKVASLKNSSPKNLYLKEDFDQKVASLDISSSTIPSFITKLTWTHYRRLISIKNDDERNYYTNIAMEHNLSVRELGARIKSKEYYRLDEKTRDKLIRLEDVGIIDCVKNPIIINNKNNYDVVSEKTLKLLILEDIKNFLKELGEGFCFIEDEYKIKIDDRYNYIDLLLYNIKYKCYVVVELKITEFKSEYIGQILKYMHYVDRHIKSIYEDNTIGIIICKKNNEFYMGYCSDERVIAREYRLHS